MKKEGVDEEVYEGKSRWNVIEGESGKEYMNRSLRDLQRGELSSCKAPIHERMICHQSGCAAEDVAFGQEMRRWRVYSD